MCVCGQTSWMGLVLVIIDKCGAWLAAKMAPRQGTPAGKELGDPKPSKQQAVIEVVATPMKGSGIIIMPLRGDDIV